MDEEQRVRDLERLEDLINKGKLWEQEHAAQEEPKEKPKPKPNKPDDEFFEGFLGIPPDEEKESK